MSLLLDTHALIWWWLNDQKLSPAARAELDKGEQPVFISAVSALEIAIKVRLGKLAAMNEAVVRYAELAANDGFEMISVTTHQALSAGSLPGTHRDPFDRLIAAQALDAGHTVITRDPEFAAFGCKTLW